MPSLQSQQDGLIDGGFPTRRRVAAVAFCADKFMEAPLHVAASTLLRHLNPDYTAHLFFLLTDFSERDIGRLRRTLDRTGRAYSMKLLDPAGCEIFAGFPSLHGSRATYYRILLPSLVEEERLLYLDSDIQVTVDVAPLFEIDMGAKPTGFVVSGKVESALDHKFQTSIGRPPQAPMFNAGVCLFNLDEWNRLNCTDRLLSFANEHRTELTNHDQSLLNAVFADDCYRLDSKYNDIIYPAMRRQVILGEGIYHFVGSPKPWDIGASWLLPHAAAWYKELRATAFPWFKRSSWLQRNSWARLPKIIGGYVRLLR